MATVQETIDNIIAYIDAAITKHSVSNRQVALVLSFLNEELKKTKTSFADINGKFLSKMNEDTAKKLITFAEGLKSLGDVTIGDYLEQGDTIQGAKITKEGHGSFASLKSSYMEIFELLLNKQTAVGGEFKISDVGTIEDVTYLFGQEEPYTEIKFADYNKEVHGRPWGAMLHLREDYEGYLPTFMYDDIVYGSVNGMGKSGDYATQGQFFGVVKNIDKCTLRVNIYSDEQVPAGTNLLPVPHMVITQRGNETNKKRQSVITLSAPDKSMVILNGVNSPVLDAKGHCYGISLGKLPGSLYSRVQKAFPYLGIEDMSVYAKNLIVQNLMLMDHLDQPIKTERYRGAWSEPVAKGEIEGKDKYRLTETTYDTVTHNGSKWECQFDCTTEEPSERSTTWSLIVSKGGDGKDGKDGNDGVSPNENLLGYSSDFSKKWELNGHQLVAGLNGHKAIYRKCELTNHPHEFARYIVAGTEDAVLNKGEWYTLSFYCKGAGTLALFIKTNVEETSVVDEDAGVYLDGIYKSTNSQGATNIDLTEEWVHHTYTFKTASSLDEVGRVVFGDRAKGDYYVCMPKLEYGKIATPWCKSESDKTAYGINSVSTEYMATDSFDKPGVSDKRWSAQSPDVAVGQYLWTKVVTDYTGPDIEDTVAITVSRAGADGTSITVIDVSYAKSENATTPPESGWQSHPYPLLEGEYLWTRTTFSDGTPQYTVSKNGDNLKISSIQYAKTSEKNADPSRLAYSDTVPTSEPGFYIWTKTTYSDGQIDYAPAYLPNDGVSPNLNLLNNTSFEKMDGWQSKTGSTFNNYPIGEVVENLLDGVAALHLKKKLENGHVDFLLQKTSVLQPSTWYTFSFYCKGNATIGTFVYPDVCSGSVYIDGAANDGVADDTYVLWNVSNTTGWKRHYVTFKTKEDISGDKIVLFRMIYSAANVDQDIYISMPKLERGDVLTSWSYSMYDLSHTGANDNILSNSMFSPNEEGVIAPWIEVNGELAAMVHNSNNGWKHQWRNTGSSNKNCLMYDLSGLLKPSTYYTLSFYLRGYSSAKGFSSSSANNNGSIVSFVNSTTGGAPWGFGLSTLIYDIATGHSSDKEETGYELIDVNAAYYYDGKSVYRTAVVQNGFIGYIGSVPWFLEYCDEYTDNVQFPTVASKAWVKHTYTFKTAAQANFDKIEANGGLPRLIFRAWPNSYIEIASPKIEEGVVSTPWSKSEIDWIGPAGDDGALVLPYGYWDREAVDEDDPKYSYKLVKNELGKISVRPALFHKTNAEDKGTYYVLQKDIPYDDNTEEKLGKLPYWKPFTKMGYVLAEALMALWAKLGGTHGGVFYEKYLFSQTGTSGSGTSGYMNFTKGDNLMFDSKGNLNGLFIPHLFLDFKTGAAKVGRFSESFLNYPTHAYGNPGNYIKRMSFDSCHNISHEPITSLDAPMYPDIVLLPKVMQGNRWIEDGTHCTVLHKFDLDYTINPNAEGYRNAALVVCADEIIFDASQYSNMENFLGKYKKNGWMLWNGVKVKFVFLVPGSMLRLRSFTYSDSDGDKLIWYIENSSDFEIMTTQIEAYGDYNNQVEPNHTFASEDSLSHLGEDNPLCPIIGSPAFNRFEMVSVFRTSWILDASGDSEDKTSGAIKPVLFHK